MAELCEFEKARAERVARNNAVLSSLVRSELRDSIAGAAAAAAPRRRRASEPREPVGPPRRSVRAEGRPAVNYAHDLDDGRPASRKPRNAGPPRYTRKRLTLEELEAMTEEEKEALKGPGGIDSGRGRRVQGGRIYDSALGNTCHWCRQKTVELKVTCTSKLCSVGRLPHSFCGACLQNRHGEDVTAAAAAGNWLCPRCRGGCGPGCGGDGDSAKHSCCNCGPCRKKSSLLPTGSLAGTAQAHGYTNAHDYLVGQTTGETQAQLDARKVAKGWGAWLFNPARLPAPATPVLPQGGAPAPAAAAPEAEEAEAAPPAAAAPAAKAAAGRISKAFPAAKAAASPAAAGKAAGKKRAAEAEPPATQRRASKAARA